METKTVNTELWDMFFAADGKYYITTSANDAAEAYTKETAELIVTAVNACKAINPDNPLAVAKILPELVEALKMGSDIIHHELKPVDWHTDPCAISDCLNTMDELLKQATE